MEENNEIINKSRHNYHNPFSTLIKYNFFFYSLDNQSKDDLRNVYCP